MQRRRVQGQPVVRSPQVQHVPLRCTSRVETTEDVLLQIDREGSAALVRRFVQWAGAAQLRRRARAVPELVQHTEVLQDLP